MKNRTKLISGLLLAAGMMAFNPSITADASKEAGVGVTSGASKVVQQAAQETREVLGYYTFYSPKDKGSYNSLASYHSYVHDTAILSFAATETGEIQGSAPQQGMQLIQKEQVGAFAGISNAPEGNFDPQVAHAVISDPVVRKKAISNLVQVVKSNGFQGVNIDFENMAPEDRAAYTAFIRELTEKMHAQGAKVMISVTAKTTDAPKSNWVGTFDYAALGKVVDRMQMMTYDENGPWGEPGPVASDPWVEKVLKYATSQVPAEKLLIGLPAYGYDWNLNDKKANKAVAWKAMPNLLSKTGAAPQWDDKSKSPHLSYQAADGSQHIVWYENGDSIQAKVQLAVKYKLAGVSVWRMGLEDESFWKAVKSGLQQS
ncbi:MAG: glycosyl hydrolase family 18 protein [Tumebacillaceae bacterium]